MSLYLLSRWHPDSAYEVLSYDKVNNTAVLRGPDGVVSSDPNFHICIIKRCFTLTEEEPACLGGGMGKKKDSSQVPA
jgi:hypothetical protein